MARGKPSIFSREQRSAKRAARKRSAEAALRAGTLPRNPPAELKGLPAARRAWSALLRAHDQLPGELFNGLDRDFLVGYCLAIQARANALDLERMAKGMFVRGEITAKDLLKVRAELRMATRLAADLEKQIYATPKSRGGVTPPARQLSPAEVVERELADYEEMLGDDDDHAA
jgi:hypothetical protein